MKRRLKYLPLLIALILIIFFNLQSKEDSMKLSNYVANLFKDNVYIYTHIRKLAHIVEYFILGISTYIVLKKKSIYLNILISLLDQTLKYLLPIRHFDITDIPYDLIGYLTAYALCFIIISVKTKEN